MQWEGSFQATTYDVYFDTTYPPLNKSTVVGTSITLPVSPDGTTYYWKVVAKNTCASVSAPPAGAWSFVACAPPPAGILIARWKFDEHSGWTAADDSGRDHAGQLDNGPAWHSAEGKIDGALQFDGIDDVVTVDDTCDLRLTEDFTISAWVNITAPMPTDWVRVVGKGNGSLQNYSLWYRWKASQNQPAIMFKISNGTTDAIAGTNTGTIHSPTDLPTGQWHLMTGVKQGNVIYLYLNGTLIASNSINLTPPVNNDPLTIGHVEGGIHHKGMIDDVRLHSRSLSQAEIQALFDLCTMPTDFNLVAPVDSSRVIGSSVTLQWTASNLATAYDVYFGTSNPPPLYQTVETGTSISVPTGSSPTTYYWRVVARNTCSSVSAPIAGSWSFVACTPPPSGILIAHWKLDESAGLTASDDSGLGHEGVLENGPSWHPVEGKLGGALQFDGFDDVVRVADNCDLRLTGDFTISAWVNITAPMSTNWVRVVGKGSGTPQTYGLWYRWKTSGNTPVVMFKISNGTTDASAGSNLGTVHNQTSLPTGVWHLMTGVRQGNMIYMYLNGTLIASNSIAITPPDRSDPLTIGRIDGGTDHKGMIDDVRLYSRALSQAEIQALNASYIPRPLVE